MKPLLIGQAPSRTSDPKEPLDDRRISSLFGVSHDDYLKLDRVNVLDFWPGRFGKGDAFPMKAARMSAISMDLTGRSVLIFGRAAARAFGITADFFEEVNHGGSVVHVVPHMSGINLWWNDRANRATALCFFHEWWRTNRCAA